MRNIPSLLSTVPGCHLLYLGSFPNLLKKKLYASMRFQTFIIIIVLLLQLLSAGGMYNSGRTAISSTLCFLPLLCDDVSYNIVATSS